MVPDPNSKNIGLGDWTYSIADSAFDFLAVGETLTLTYMARVDNNFAPNNETTLLRSRSDHRHQRPADDRRPAAFLHRAVRNRQPDDRFMPRVSSFADVDLTDHPGREHDVSANVRSLHRHAG